MAQWNTNVKHEPSSINNGNQYEKKDRVSREQLNALAENSFYAVNKSEEAIEKANSAFKANGTLVTINGENQTTWSADFVENERQKSLGEDGAIVHKKDLNNIPIFFDYKNAISISGSTLTTLGEYFDLFNQDTTACYKADIGALVSSKFKDLVGYPFGNYTQCVIRLYANGNDSGYLQSFELFAVDHYGTNFAKGYIYKQENGNVVFSGWKH